MSEQEIITWFGTLWPGPQVKASHWAFSFGETLHFVGLCVLLGAMLFVDLRLLGFYKSIPVKAVLAVLPWAIVGFLINASTGWLFFTSNPGLYWGNSAFRIKVLLILFAGINALIFTVVEHRQVAHIGPGEDTPTFTKATAALSLVLWFGILLIGRMLPLFTISVN
jgi:hypothetical protein